MYTNSTSAVAGIYRELEHDIMSLKLMPGELLSENQLCERFSVSRTPVRAVLQRLAQEELVEILPKKGTRVTRIDYHIVDQIIYQRKAVECMVLRDFIRVCSPADISIVRNSIEELKAIHSKYKDRPEYNGELFREADLKMHEIWFRHMQRMYLWENIRKTQSSYTRFCMLDIIELHNYEDVIDEHDLLLGLIESRNESGIESLLNKHLYGGISRLGSKIFNEFRDFFVPESIEI